MTVFFSGSPLLPDAVRIADTEKIRLVLKLSLPFVMQTAQYNEESEQAGIKVSSAFPLPPGTTV